MICFGKVPKEKMERHWFLEVTSHLQSYKEVYDLMMNLCIRLGIKIIPYIIHIGICRKRNNGGPCKRTGTFTAVGKVIVVLHIVKQGWKKFISSWNRRDKTEYFLSIFGQSDTTIPAHVMSSCRT